MNDQIKKTIETIRARYQKLGDCSDLVALADAYIEMREALEWYGEKAGAAARATETKNVVVMEALLVELSLDAGRRARAVLDKYAQSEGGDASESDT